MTDVDYVPISVATLLPTEVVGLDLFQEQAQGNQFKLYRGAQYPLTMDDLKRLRNRGIHRLYIPKSAQNSYQKYLRKLAASSSRETIPLSARAGALSEVVRDVLQSAFSTGETDRAVNAAEKLGMLATDIITRDEFAASDLFEVLHHDYATFTHSANVAFYCGILGAELGFSKREIEQITTGGLLHDLGKLEIEEAILCKPGKLTEAEFRKIKLHPVLGFRRIAHRTDLNEGQILMAYQHHERNDGGGYPVGCVDDEIHPWAKLCAIVDVFEALTSQRPYRSPMSHTKAIAVLRRDSGTAFDPEMLECWTSIIQRNLAN